MDIKDQHLRYTLVLRETLTESDIQRMFSLMSQNYNHMTYDCFVSDLSNKQYVGLIVDKNNEIQGFTTFGIDLGNQRQNEFRIVFSGDTILEPEHWGTQIMMRGWCHTIGQIISTDNEHPWYWYLLSKGHRTYMYLPLFFTNYYPKVDHDSPNSKEWEIINHVSSNLYQDDWKPNKVIIEFDQRHGELKEELIQSTYSKKRSTYVSFFLEKNPAFYKGNELVCLAQLTPENLNRSAKTYILEGMKEPLKMEV